MRRVGGGDLGFVRDSAAFTANEEVEGFVRVLGVLELRPAKGAPLKPSEVYAQAAAFFLSFGVDKVMLDHHYIESAREGFAKLGITVVAAPGGQDGKVAAHLAVKRLLVERRLALPAHARLIAQLKAIRSKPTTGGGLTIEAPRRGGSHGDVASAAVLGIYHASLEERAQTPPRVVARVFNFDTLRFEDGSEPPAPAPTSRFDADTAPIEPTDLDENSFAYIKKYRRKVSLF